MIQEIGDVPQVDAQPVMYCFISPDIFQTKVNLEYTLPYFNSDVNASNPIISNAIVSLLDKTNGDSINIPFMLGTYAIDSTVYRIKPGHTYILRARFDNKLLEANCIVPDTCPLFTSLSASKFSRLNFRNDTQYAYNIVAKWNDFPIQKNYYSIYFNGTEIFNTDTQITQEGNPVLLNDASNDGTELLVTHTTQDRRGQSTNSTYETCFLLNCDANFYEYHVRRYKFNRSDPFSEPVQMFSNVHNGIGCFGAFRMIKKTVLME